MRRELQLAALIALATIRIASAIDTTPPKPPTPSGRVIPVRDTITLNRRNNTYDFKGATLVWKGRGDCSQAEDMPPIFRITASGITVKNATIKGAPDGIHIVASNVTITNVSFPDVCEDAITMKKGALWSRISHCYFSNAADKAIQCSYGFGHRIHDNIFVRVKCAFRSKAGVRSSFFRNILYHCGNAVRADGRGSNTMTGRNQYAHVKQPYEIVDDQAVIRQIENDTLLR